MTNLITYDLETHITDRTRPYVFCFDRFRKLVGKYNRNLTPYELNKCKKGTIAFDGDNCVSNASDFCLKLKGEERRNKKIKFWDIIYHHTHMIDLDLILG